MDRTEQNNDGFGRSRALNFQILMDALIVRVQQALSPLSIGPNACFPLCLRSGNRWSILIVEFRLPNIVDPGRD